MDTSKALWTGTLIILCSIVWRFVRDFWWRPRALAAALQRQGLNGPPRKFMVGNTMELLKMRHSAKEHDMDTVSHDILEHVLPDHYQWSNKYGKSYVFWWGTQPRIVVSFPEFIREVLSKKPGPFGKLSTKGGLKAVFGNGLVFVNGEEWAHHRRVVAPSFYFERLKGMVESIVHCTSEMLDKWEMKLLDKPELDISDEMHKFAADVISHTAFGSNYLKGQRVFELLTSILKLLHNVLPYEWVPGSRFLPFRANVQSWKMQAELNSLVLGMINKRREMIKHGKVSYGNDLLSLMLAESEKDSNFTFNDQILVDECKTFYFAGQETTGTLLSWAMFLLALYPDWQHKLRTEILETCKDGIPVFDVLSKLKLMGMVLNETLRLYPPVVFSFRACYEATTIGDLHIPKGASLAFPILAIHHDPELWGPDVNEFNPERFRDGISSACKHPNGFMPFLFGPRVCIGQAFALIESKVALAMTLRRFSFELSPSYRHNPGTRPALHSPVHGIPLILNKL